MRIIQAQTKIIQILNILDISQSYTNQILISQTSKQGDYRQNRHIFKFVYFYWRSRIIKYLLIVENIKSIHTSPYIIIHKPDMLPVVCLTTFTAFSGYWLTVSALKKSVQLVKKISGRDRPAVISHQDTSKTGSVSNVDGQSHKKVTSNNKSSNNQYSAGSNIQQKPNLQKDVNQHTQKVNEQQFQTQAQQRQQQRLGSQPDFKTTQQQHAGQLRQSAQIQAYPQSQVRSMTDRIKRQGVSRLTNNTQVMSHVTENNETAPYLQIPHRQTLQNNVNNIENITPNDKQLSVNSANNQLNIAMIEQNDDPKVVQNQNDNIIQTIQQNQRKQQEIQDQLMYQSEKQPQVNRQYDERDLSPNEQSKQSSKSSLAQSPILPQSLTQIQEQHLNQIPNQNRLPQMPKNNRILQYSGRVVKPQQQNLEQLLQFDNLYRKYTDAENEKTELQIIQALKTNKSLEKQEGMSELVSEFKQDRQSKEKQSQDPIQRLTQQIDQLFLNDQQKFMAVINKYKIQQSKNNDNNYNYSSHMMLKKQQQENKTQIHKLKSQVSEIQREKEHIEIELSQYRQTLDLREKQIRQLKQMIEQNQQRNIQLEEQVFSIKSMCQELKASVDDRVEMELEKKMKQSNVSSIYNTQNSNTKINVAPYDDDYSKQLLKVIEKIQNQNQTLQQRLINLQQQLYREFQKNKELEDKYQLLYYQLNTNNNVFKKNKNHNNNSDSYPNSNHNSNNNSNIINQEKQLVEPDTKNKEVVEPDYKNKPVLTVQVYSEGIKDQLKITNLMSNLSPKSAEILESNVGKEDGKMNKNIVALNLTIKSLANLNQNLKKELQQQEKQQFITKKQLNALKNKYDELLAKEKLKQQQLDDVKKQLQIKREDIQKEISKQREQIIKNLTNNSSPKKVDKGKGSNKSLNLGSGYKTQEELQKSKAFIEQLRQERNKFMTMYQDLLQKTNRQNQARKSGTIKKNIESQQQNQQSKSQSPSGSKINSMRNSQIQSPQLQQYKSKLQQKQYEVQIQRYKNKKLQEQFNSKQQQYLDKLNKFEQEISKIRKESIEDKKKYNQQLIAISNKLQQKQKQRNTTSNVNPNKNKKQLTLNLTENQQNKQQQLLKLLKNTEQIDQQNNTKRGQIVYVPISTRQNLAQSSIRSEISQDNLRHFKQLQEANENLKYQIQFAQTQIRMLEENQQNYHQQIQELQRLLQNSNYTNQAHGQGIMIEDGENSHNPIKQVIDLRSKVSKLQPIANQYQKLHRKYCELKLKYQRLVHENEKEKSRSDNNSKNIKKQSFQYQQQIGSSKNIPKNVYFPASVKVGSSGSIPNTPNSSNYQLKKLLKNINNYQVKSSNNQNQLNSDQKQSIKIKLMQFSSPVLSSPNSVNNNNVRQGYNSAVYSSKNINTSNYNQDDKTNIIGNNRFLTDCSFLGQYQKLFVYQTLRSLLKGVLKTQKLYNSVTNRYKNPHDLIDNLRGILVLIQLQNHKILGAYTHQCFSSLYPNSTAENIAFILDVTNRKYFANQSGLNSINYNSNNLVWGFSQIMLKFEEPEILYTNFCRNHNIYWDGKYKIQEFIGQDKQWARITQYQIYRVTKI